MRQHQLHMQAVLCPAGRPLMHKPYGSNVALMLPQADLLLRCRCGSCANQLHTA